MKKRIILTGPIGSGKSTLLERHLRPFPSGAGGFLTRRILKGSRLQGFDLSAVRPGSNEECGRFLDFTSGTPMWNGSVFAQYGAALLRDACQRTLAVFDELGGPELLIPEFSQSLDTFLESGVPAVCVVKSMESAKTMVRTVSQPGAYLMALETLWDRLYGDEDTMIIEIAGYGDPCAARALDTWLGIYGYRT